MTRTIRSAAVAAIATAALLVSPRALAPVAVDARTPKLIVLLVVDQLRADYLDRFGHQWTGGLRRLMTDGAWFRQAEYPYASTVTCVGHATISTGTLPSRHGMILNAWWDRHARKLVACTEDESATTVSYGKPLIPPGESLARLRGSTLADELRAQLTPASRVIVFSLKARAAAPLGGRHPDAIAWLDDSGAWATSSAFSAGPLPEIADFVARHPVDADFTKTWDRALPRSAYLFENPAIGVSVPSGNMTRGFPHSLAGQSRAPDRGFYLRWQSSPLADEYLARMALDVAKRMQLGSRASPDMIGISFSTLDKVGHDFGPNSHEVQDVLIRLDRTLAELFTGLELLVGAGDFVVALTGDHGVAPVPERAAQFGLDAGRVNGIALGNTMRAAFVKAFGPGSYISRLADWEVYLQPGVFDKLRNDPATLEAIRAAARATPGIEDLYTSDELERAAAGADHPALLHYAASHFPGRSGDLTLVLKPYWIMRGTGTTHGSPFGYDTRVPLLLLGKGIARGEYLARSSPLDIAPTLAFLAGITLPQAQGRVLSEALSTLPATSPLASSSSR